VFFVDPGITNKRFSQKKMLQYLLCENLVLRAPTVNNSTKIDAKNDLETSSKKTKNLTHRNPKNFQKGVPKSAEITENLVLGPHVSFHGPLGYPQADKMVLKVGKW
jgi:hypothetical protein